ncbi:hypothetical protein JCM11641_004301 [Rhodosporidiobolus odoratus]
MDLKTPTQPQLEPQSALTDRLDRLTLSASPASVGAQPNALSGPAPGLQPGGEPTQRSQRFTVPVPTSSPIPALPSFPTTNNSLLNPLLPYQPPPRPVQTQSIPVAPPSLNFFSSPSHDPPHRHPQRHSFYSSSEALHRQYSSSGSSSSSTGAGAGAGTGVEGLAPAFAVGGNGSGGPGFPTQYRGHQANEFLTPSSSSSASGGVYRSAIENGSGNGGNGRGSGAVSPVSSAGYGAGAGGSRMQGGQQQQSGVVVNGEGEEIIETAIVIKSIPFAATKEQVLALMASLSLPVPHAFNFHHDSLTGQFRGLAFANYKTPEEARRVVEGLGGAGMLGRTLHVEPKRALKPGEKEAIEREKQLKRIRSVQVLACAGAGGGAGGGGREGWNRREGSMPAGGGAGGYGQPLQQQSSFGFGQPQQYQSHLQQQQQWYAHGQPQLPLSHHFHSQQQASEHEYGHSNYPLFLTSSASSSSPYPLPQQQQQPHQQYQPYHLPTDLDYAPTLNSSPPGSEVGTSVSMRTTLERGLTGGASTDGMCGEWDGGRDGVGIEGGRRRTASDELDLNDSATLDIYSLILLFRDDPLRDELAFARSLGTSQRRVVHLVAKKLRLQHRSVGEEGQGERRVVVSKGEITTLVAGVNGASGVGRKNDVDAHFAPRVQLRHSASTASVSLRRPASHSNLLLNPPTTPSRYPNGNNANASSTSTSSYLSPSPSLGALNLRGKKSMPDIRYSRDGHILPPPPPPPSSSSAFYSYRSSSSGGGEGLSPVSSSSRSASPAPPPPPPVPLLSQSTSLSANLAAYSNGFGYASTQHQHQHQHSDGNGNGSGGAGGIGKGNGNGVYLTPQANHRRRSQMNLREGYATIAGVPRHSASSTSFLDDDGMGEGLGMGSGMGMGIRTPTRSLRAGGGREVPSVIGMFGSSGAESQGLGQGQGKSMLWSTSTSTTPTGGTPGKAEPVRQPRGPMGEPGEVGERERGEGLEWRRRA